MPKLQRIMKPNGTFKYTLNIPMGVVRELGLYKGLDFEIVCVDGKMILKPIPNQGDIDVRGQ